MDARTQADRGNRSVSCQDTEQSTPERPRRNEPARAWTCGGHSKPGGGGWVARGRKPRMWRGGSRERERWARGEHRGYFPQRFTEGGEKRPQRSARKSARRWASASRGRDREEARRRMAGATDRHSSACLLSIPGRPAGPAPTAGQGLCSLKLCAKYPLGSPRPHLPRSLRPLAFCPPLPLSLRYWNIRR